MSENRNVAFAEELCVGSDAEKLPDGNYPAVLSRVEMQRGKKFQSEEPQDKLVFVFTVMGGEHASAEAWSYVNLPDAGADGRRKKLSPKSRLFDLVTSLRGGKPLAEGESFSPAAYIGTQGFVSVSSGKLTFLKMDMPQPQQAPPPAYAERVDAESQANNGETTRQSSEVF